MAEKVNQFANGQNTRGDEESANSQSAELKRKKRIKLAIYIAIFAVFQIIVITVFGLVVMRAKSPKLRLSKDFEFQNLKTTSTPSFDMSFTTEVTVKNPNWGPYKFRNTTAIFSHDGAVVGQVVIPKGKAGMKSTKKIDVTVHLSSAQLANTAKLGSELNGGILTLTSTAEMSGKVELMLIMKKNKSANMNCTIAVDVANKTLRSLLCK